VIGDSYSFVTACRHESFFSVDCCHNIGALLRRVVGRYVFQNPPDCCFPEEALRFTWTKNHSVSSPYMFHPVRNKLAPSELEAEAKGDALGGVVALTKLDLVIEVSQDAIRPVDVDSRSHIKEVPLRSDTLNGKCRTSLGQGGGRRRIHIPEFVPVKCPEARRYLQFIFRPVPGPLDTGASLIRFRCLAIHL